MRIQGFTPFLAMLLFAGLSFAQEVPPAVAPEDGENVVPAVESVPVAPQPQEENVAPESTENATPVESSVSDAAPVVPVAPAVEFSPTPSQLVLPPLSTTQICVDGNCWQGQPLPVVSSVSGSIICESGSCFPFSNSSTFVSAGVPVSTGFPVVSGFSQPVVSGGCCGSTAPVGVVNHGFVSSGFVSQPSFSCGSRVVRVQSCRPVVRFFRRCR